MKRPQHTLAIVTITALVSCTTPAPASTPTSVAVALRIYTTTATSPLVADLTRSYTRLDPALTFESESGNFQIMLDRLLRGEMPYFVSNHLPAESQLARDLWAAPIGQEGIAVVTHRDLPVGGLTMRELRDIYQGYVGNWLALDGPDLDIVVISREEGSGTRAEFEQSVMGTRRTTQAARVAPSSAAVIASVAQTPGSIGYVSSSYVSDGVRALALDGILPAPENIADNTYPLRSTVFVVGLAEPEDHYRAFIGWIQSPAGQAIVARHIAPLLNAP